MSKLINDLRKAYIEVLKNTDSLYHFEDDPLEVITGKIGERRNLFSTEESVIINDITYKLGRKELCELATEDRKDKDD